jgi:hypothetical protein
MPRQTNLELSPQPPQEVVFDLSQRLPPQLLSRAWEHLSALGEDPSLPMPPELAHLTEPEWSICLASLESTMALKELLPLH